MVHAFVTLRPSSSNRALACAFSSGSIGMVRFVRLEAIVPTPFRALWGIIPRKREWFNDFCIIYTWITHENTWTRIGEGKRLFFCAAPSGRCRRRARMPGPSNAGRGAVPAACGDGRRAMHLQGVAHALRVRDVAAPATLRQARPGELSMLHIAKTAV